MCWACDNPGGDPLRYMNELMVRHGWAVQGVERDRDKPPWAYTVGLTEAGLPELVVTGMQVDDACDLLNDVAQHVVHAEPPAPGERIPLVGGPLLEVVRVTTPDAHLHTAVALFGSRVSALQLVWADDRGHWPWQPGFRGLRGGQPVLGRRSGRRTRRGCGSGGP